jgi:hypothetical protein
VFAWGAINTIASNCFAGEFCGGSEYCFYDA